MEIYTNRGVSHAFSENCTKESTSSGVYFYNLVAGSNSITKNMLLIK